MREALDLKSKSGVHRLISALEERGFIRRLPNRARALEVVKLPETRTAATATPLRPAAAGRRPTTRSKSRCTGGSRRARRSRRCRAPRRFAVPAALLGPGEHYALEVSGDSMVEEGILDGDFALIRKVDTARDGEIVVALINNEEATLKTFRREGNMIRLDPANRNYEPQRYDPSRSDPGPARRPDPAVLRMAEARIDYVELPSATAHELTRAFYAKAFGWEFTDYGPTYSATTNGDDRRRAAGRSGRRALGAAAGDPRRRSRSGVRRGDQGRRHDRQADLLLPGRPPVPFHRSGGSELAVWSAA